MTHTSDAVVRRLVFIKYLHHAGLDQSEAPEPICAAALLTFHDATELFLQLASERFNVGGKRVEFMQYFDHLDPLLARPLAQREAIRRLNNARISLKHHGTMPAKRDVLAFGSALDDFFASNTPLVFNLEFAAISLASLVSNTDVRECLVRADRQVGENSLGEALASVAEAFTRLLHDYGIGAHSAHDLEKAGREIDKAIDSRYSTGPAERLANVVENLAEELALLRHTVDTRRLTVFRAMTPSVSVSTAGKAYVVWFFDPATVKLETIRFCYDFVIESAMRIEHIHSVVDSLPLTQHLRSDFGLL